MSPGTGRDYQDWLAHSDTSGGDLERNGCVLGAKEVYRRRKKQSVCRNGRAFAVIKKQHSCLCTREDFLWYTCVFAIEPPCLAPL